MVHIEEHEFTSSSGHTTFYLAAGPQNGPLMIFCHGWPAIAKTWMPQLEIFAGLGFRVVAPDMPGYGRSSISKNSEDYCLEKINQVMLQLLQHCEREQAVWVGHDWGAVAVWSFVAHYPSKTIAAIGLARPYHTLEFGLEEILPTINRDIFPTAQYPYGQYDYQHYFETSLTQATSFFDSDPEAALRAIYAKGRPDEVGKPGLTATVTRDGGWFGGAPSPPPQLRQIPFQAMCVDPETFTNVLDAMKRNGFWSANAWYVNHQRNRTYSLEKSENDGFLDMPVLFVGANWDPISDIGVSKIAHAQKEYCRDLTEVRLDAGHWVALERPAEVNAAVVKWLVEKVPGVWPSKRAEA